MPHKIDLEQAYGFSLFVLKAVLSCCGIEIVELVKMDIVR
jgi:hypothetical protein